MDITLCRDWFIGPRRLIVCWHWKFFEYEDNKYLHFTTKCNNQHSMANSEEVSNVWYLSCYTINNGNRQEMTTNCSNFYLSYKLRWYCLNWALFGWRNLWWLRTSDWGWSCYNMPAQADHFNFLTCVENRKVFFALIGLLPISNLYCI